tara:strand:+ start:374 stop:736 length:363 start_codon:yes stop_codon:yes gene_type:complete
MVLKRLPLDWLQPTDTLRDRTMSFYSSLGKSFYSLEEIPQVWNTSRGLLVSDGNNYVVYSARDGQLEVNVDLKGEEEGVGLQHYISELEEDAEVMRSLGVRSPFDLVGSIDWGKVGKDFD